MQETYKFIVDFIKENGYSPSYREIANGAGCALSTVVGRLEKLVEFGMIEMKPNCQRTIKVTGYSYVKGVNEKMNYRELFTKLYDDKCFKNFCNTIDEMRNKEYKIEIPLETLALLVSSNVNYINGEDNIEVIHNCVKHFLNPSGLPISKTTSFYDYFVITNIMWIADGKREQLEGNRWIQPPLDLTEYANSICKFDTCTCEHKPQILFSCFCGSLTGKVICEKCNLSVSEMFIYNDLHPPKPISDIYVNLEDGIKRLSELWNEEVAKNESILHRTMRELLSYGSNVCVNKVIYDLHEKLYAYMTEKGIGSLNTGMSRDIGMLQQIR